MNNVIRVCAVIPARYSSSRFPGKPLAKIAGKSMIQHVYERVSQAQNIDMVIVATDDHRILKLVNDFGGRGVLTSGDHATGTDRIAEAIQSVDCELVVNVQGDEPLIEPDLIDTVIHMFDSDGVSVVTPITQITDQAEIENPNVVKVTCDIEGYALYFSRYPIPFVRDIYEREDFKWYKHIGLYGYRKDFLIQLVKLPQSRLEKVEKLEQLRIIENGYRIKTVITEYNGIGVDTPDDLKEVLKRL